MKVWDDKYGKGFLRLQVDGAHALTVEVPGTSYLVTAYSSTLGRKTIEFDGAISVDEMKAAAENWYVDLMKEEISLHERSIRSCQAQIEALGYGERGLGDTLDVAEPNGRYEIEVTIDVVGGNGEELGFKMAGNDLEEMQAGILPAVQKACAEQGYLDNQVVVGVLIEENGEWLDSDEEILDLSELNVEICVYVDSLGYNIDDSGPKDNLTNILVPKAWLLEKLKAEGETDFEGWFEEYTADSTDIIAREAVSEDVILSCTDKGISCVLGLGESFLQTNDYGKRLAAHMREVYQSEYEKGDYSFWGTYIIGGDSVKTAEEAAGWCLLTYGDRALQEVQEWIDDKEPNVFGFDILDVRNILENCTVPLKDNSLTARLADATEKSEKQDDSKVQINLDEYEQMPSRVDGYDVYRKILRDENGKRMKGIWAAAKEGVEPFAISYEQALGREPIDDSPIKRLSRQLGEMLLP